MVHDGLETGSQCCFNKFDSRLFISRLSQFAFCLSLSLSVISKSLAQFCWKCCNHSVSVVLCWMCDSPRTGCTWRTTPIYMCHKQAELEWARRGISGVAWCHSEKLCIFVAWASHHNKVVLWPECEGGARCNLHKENLRDRCGSLQKRGDVVATSQLMLRWKCDSPQMGCAQRATNK